MARVREVIKNPAFRNAISFALLPVIVGPVLGAWIQEQLFDGWVYGAVCGLVLGAAGSGIIGVPLYLLIKVIGRH